jgi:hypothetical protein
MECSFKNASDLTRAEVLCSILIELVVPVELVRLVTMYSNEMYSRVCTDKLCLIIIPSKRHCNIDTPFQLSFNKCHWEHSGKPEGTEIKLNASPADLC